MKKITFIMLLVFFTLPLFARDVTIYVLDLDLDLPLEGAIVRVWDGNQYVCDIDGKAVIQVPDRQIIVQAAYPGYETGRIVIPVTGNSFTIQLRLLGIMQSRELVIEASRPGTNDSRTGRSIAVGEREIAQTAEMGVIEDVMSTIKLLPGVSYTGTMGAQPSIRGGYPGDMSAAFDGFYINNPYHWGGAFSIFDPRMVQSAQLSHGVFSARYGNTISGLLDITSKKPSSTETQIEIGAGSSTANFNLSLPFSGNGGIMFMGRVTFYEPVILLAKELSNSIPELSVINSIRKAPYIRSGALSGNYRLTNNLELTAVGFFGMDGVGVNYYNYNKTSELKSESILDFDFDNLQGFIITSFLWNPRNDMLFKFTAGSGYEETNINGNMTNNISKSFSDEFNIKYGAVLTGIKDPYELNNNMFINQTDFNFNLQGRLDFDWELSNNFLISAGVQEMFNSYRSSGNQQMSYESLFVNLSSSSQALIQSFFLEIPSGSPFWNDLRVSIPGVYSPNVQNNLFSTSAYILTEFNTNDNRLNAELGLRMDHFFLTGDGFTASSDITLNPRLNIDLIVLKNAGFLQSLSVSAGTGLFSSINSNIFSAEERYNVTHIKPNRSWTSILGIKFEFPESLSLNIEAYYKYIFDRMYLRINTNPGETEILPNFDGEGISWGIDVMLHKIHSRYWDGWISYSYNWTKYKDPNGRIGGPGFSGGNRGDDWYFPTFHRFHNLNLILNYRPIQSINIYFRFGLASGRPLSRRIGDGPESYPVLIYGEDKIIEKYYWDSVIDENNRTTFSLPMDIKLSILGTNRTGKTRYEVYIAVENVLALLYTAEGNTSFNQYTGRVDTGSNTASYDMPIPIPSIGVKINY